MSRLIRLLLFVAAFAVAACLDAVRLCGQDPFAKDLVPPSAVKQSTIDTTIPRAADSTPSTSSVQAPATPEFTEPVVTKPAIIILSTCNAASFCYARNAAKEKEAIARLSEQYTVYEVRLTQLPAILSLDDARLFVPEPCTLRPGCEPIAGLIAALDQYHKDNPHTSGGVTANTPTVLTAKRDTRAHNPSVPQTASAVAPPTPYEPTRATEPLDAKQGPPADVVNLGQPAPLETLVPRPDPAFSKAEGGRLKAE